MVLHGLAFTLALGLVDAVPLENGISPDGRFEVLLESDHDKASFAAYEFKGDDGAFPGLLVRDSRTGAILARVVWPGAAMESDVLLRERTRVHWRPDSRAVAINTRDAHYAHCAVLRLGDRAARFEQVTMPPYEELTGQEKPPWSLLRSRAREFATGWTASGALLFETWLWGAVDYPLSYGVQLDIDSTPVTVEGRAPVSDEVPSW